MVTTAQQIKEMAIKEVSISGFDNDFINLKLRSISIMGLVSKGKIPNMLLGKAVEMFEGKKTSSKIDSKEDETKKVTELIDLICENVMIEPTYSEIGDFLNDTQKMEIFYFSQGGLRGLESFRNVKKSVEHTTDSAEI